MTRARDTANAAGWDYQAGATYTASPGEKILADANANNVAITPPASPADMTEFEVSAWRNSVNVVSVVYDGSHTIADAAADFTPFQLNASYTFVWSATLNTWRVIKVGVMA